jgi:hypothetical protein
LAVLALLQGKHSPEAVRGALAWLVQQKDARGTWHSTQATVLALKALLAGTGPVGGGERRLRLTWAGQTRELVIPADQAEVMWQTDLSAALKPGTHRLTVEETSGTAAGYQVAFRYHVPGTDRPGPAGPLAVDVKYDRSDLRVGDTVTATASVKNRTPQAAPMVILDLPIPPGFGLETADLDAEVKAGRVARYQVTPRTVIVYLRGR